MSSIIILQDVGIKFKLDKNKTSSLKEFAIKKFKKQLQYNEFWALKNINLDIKKGEIIGILGRNGAGKSTLLKVISGIMKPTEGEINIFGSVVPMLELGAGFDFELSGRENIFLNGAILGYSEEFLNNNYDNIIEFSELGQFIDNPIKTYSSGMLMRLAFSIATVVNPDILILDEILAVGDIGFQEKSRNKMLEMINSGITVLFVSHMIEQIQEMCDRVIWLENGKIKEIGETDSICKKYVEHYSV
ncbi:MAG: ABC transporter ATP-binding protein [Clostridiales bacterium]|nr:ABC transporter ATP-binding protein [Clostridiales bacterium]